MASPTLFNGTLPSALTQVTPSLPCDPQPLSRLVQLPAELRLMILRDLLVRCGSICARELYDHPYLVHNKGRERDSKGRFVKQPRISVVSGHYLTPSIIRTCQHFFHEALPVLYRENSLQIDIQTCWNRSGLISGPRQPSEAQVMLSMLDSTNLVNILGPHTTMNQTLQQLAHRFRNFVIVVKGDAGPQHLPRLRVLLTKLQPMFISSNIEVIICNSYSPTSSTIQPILEVGRHLQLIKSFTLLRCAKFHFTRPSDPAAVAIQDTIMGCTPIVNLSGFDTNVVLILDMLLDRLSRRANRRQELQSLKSRLTEAVADIDVNAFLQTRFDILHMWVKFDLKVRHEYGRYHQNRDEYYDLARIDFMRYHVWGSLELGCTIFEDGDEINQQLRDLAKRYNFTPIVDDRAHT